jgi:hypothetical protein
MKTFSVAILIVFCIAARVDAVTVTCAFGSITWSFVTGSFYQCDVQNKEVFTASLVSIDAAIGTHTGDKDNDDVTQFRLDPAPNLVHFPKDLDKVFPYLEAIAIYYTKLQAIKQDDLKVFPKLRVASFSLNQLKVITADTFRFNTKLERIDLDRNLIFHMEPHTFDGLKRLTALHLHDNFDNCHLTDARTKSEAADMVQKINNGKCYSRAHEVQQTLKQSLNDQQQQIQNLEKQMEQFEVLMSQMLIQIQILTKKVENI